MADVKIFQGGTPDVKFAWCAGDYTQYGFPFESIRQDGTPPFNARCDGAYALGYFTLGMPVKPSQMVYQRDAFTAANLKVGDVIRCIVVPPDHYATYLNVKLVDKDERLAGATFGIIVQEVTRNADGDFVYTNTSLIDDVAASVGVTNTIDVSGATPTNIMLPLLDIGTAPLMPLYATSEKAYVLGFIIKSLPTDDTVTFDTMLNALYLSVKIEGFDCPHQY